MNDFFSNKVILYLLKFTLYFCVFYFGCLAVIGLSAPGGLYSPFIHEYLDYISLIRYIVLHCSNLFCHIFNYNSVLDGKYVLKIVNGAGVRMVYRCVGYGIMSFWAAFVCANEGIIISKLKWILGGFLLINFLNVLRVSLLLISVQNQHVLPYNLDHHTIFNIVIYIAILGMVYVYDKKQQKAVKKTEI